MALTKKQKERMIKEFGHIPSKEEVFAKLEASLSRMTAALEGAWNTMPDDPKIRKDMIKAVTHSAKLREGIYKKVLKKPVPPRSASAGKVKT